MSNISEVNIHRRLELSIVRKFEREGFRVQASHIGHPNGPPLRWKQYQPDIYAYKGAERYYIEVITGRYLNNPSFINKLKAFSSKPGFKFGIVTPKSNVNYIKFITKKYNIRYDNLWFLDI